MAGLDPTITGALIAGGAALVGFGASAWQNAYTLRASREAAREQQLWEKRCAVYERILQVLMYPDHANMPDSDAAAPYEKGLKEQLGELLAYASDDVLEAHRSALSALERT